MERDDGKNTSDQLPAQRGQNPKTRTRMPVCHTIWNHNSTAIWLMYSSLSFSILKCAIVCMHLSKCGGLSFMVKQYKCDKHLQIFCVCLFMCM